MKTFIIVIVIAVIIGGGYMLLGKSKTDTDTVETPTTYTTPVTTPVSTSTPGTSTAIKIHNVSIQNQAFSQKSLAVKVGDTVIWTNRDSIPHTVTGGVGGPQSGTLNANQTYSFVFTTAGTFNYKCSFHPSMTGTVVVTQ